MMKRYIYVPVLIFVVVVLAFFYPVLLGQVAFPGDLLVGHYAPYNSMSYGQYGPGGVPHKAQGPDVITQLYPWKYFVIKSLVQGNLPFWNPHEFSGTPQLADFQSGAFYPGNLVFFIFNFISAWNLFIMLAPFLTIIGTYLFLRKVGLSKIPSGFGGVVFAFSSYMVVWMEYGNITHTFAFLPFILFVLEKLLKRYSIKWAVLFVGLLFFSHLAGYIQGYFYITSTAAIYYILRKIEDRKLHVGSTLMFFVLLLAPLALAAFQLLPTLKLFSYSSRGNYTLEQIQTLLNPVWYTITVLIPDFFGHPASRNQWIPVTYIERVSYFGFIPFILAVFGIVSSWKKITVRIMTMLFVLSFLITIDLFFTKFIYLLPIPVLSTTVPTRVLSIFVFSGGVLSAFGLESMLKDKALHKLTIVTSVISLVLVALWVFVIFSGKIIDSSEWVNNMAVAKRNLILPTFYLLAFWGILLLKLKNSFKNYSQYLTMLGLIVITFFDLFYFFQKVTPFSPKEYVFPQTPVISYLQEHAGLNRFWGYGSGYVSSNFQSVDGTYFIEGTDALHLKDYTAVLESTKTGSTPGIVSRADANLAPGYGTGDLSGNRFRKKIMNLLGVKYVLYKNETGKNEADIATFHPDEYRLVWEKSPWQIYQNLAVAPRFFISDSYKLLKNRKDFFGEFYSPTLDEHKTLLLEEDPELIKAKLTQKKASLISYSPNKVVIATITDAPALLFLSDAFYPEWQVKIDNNPGKVIRADYAFRAVAIPKGEHKITFYYDPTSFKLGLMVAGITAFGLMILLWKVKVKTL